jgi:hypothetical protein
MTYIIIICKTFKIVNKNDLKYWVINEDFDSYNEIINLI